MNHPVAWRPWRLPSREIDDHAVSVVDIDGREVHRFTIEHTAAALLALIRRLRKLGVREVAIERPDGPVVEALLSAGFTVVMISPNQIKNLRGRYGLRQQRAPRGPHLGVVELHLAGSGNHSGLPSVGRRPATG